MTIDVQAPRISSAAPPREIIAADFQSLRGVLPISGGWGYAKGDAVVINKDDPVVTKGTPFNGIGIEYFFVEKRIYEELIIFRPENDMYSEIEWYFIEQRLTESEDRIYDVLLFEVTAIPDMDWETLKEEWEIKDDFYGTWSELRAHTDKSGKNMIRYTAEYWFDITSFYEEHNIQLPLNQCAMK